MTYKILMLSCEDRDEFLEQSKLILEKTAERFNRDFTFETGSISMTDTAIIDNAKSAHAILLGGSINASCTRTLCKELSLYACVRRVSDCTVVSDTLGGICFGEKGFRRNPIFGREAFDVESYSELEIERVARIAYELPDVRRITLADKANELATSKLWRKIVTDINEDYPFANVEMKGIENVIADIYNDKKENIILTTKLFADILRPVLSAEPNAINYCAYLGETALGMYGVSGNALTQQSAIAVTAFMLRHSFDMQAEADFVLAENRFGGKQI